MFCFFCLLQLVTEEDGSACGLAYTIWKYMIPANVSADKVVAGTAGTTVNYVFEAGKTYTFTMSVRDIYCDLLQL